ncbi:MAG: hypothetical protein ACHP9Y_01170 [Gammaproteobacteria bacterium]
MKCYVHAEKDGAGTCLCCNKALCASCIDKYLKPSCDACALNFAKAGQKEIFRNIILTVVFAVVGLLIANSNPNASFSGYLSLAYVAMSIPWGWSALSKITPNVFLFMPFAGWAAYFVIKSGLSILVGTVAFPWKIVSTIIDWRNNKSLHRAASYSE